MKPKLTYTIIMCYNFSNAWLGKTREQRKAFEMEHVAPIFARYDKLLKRRTYDAEGFVTEFTDFMIIETTDLAHYYYMVEELRDSRLLSDGLCSIDKVFIGIEDGYLKFEDDLAEEKDDETATA